MTDSPPWGRYTDVRPEQLERIIESAPIAYVPWGALEWHGAHLPFGVDGFVAEAVAERAAERTGGVVLPTTWWPMTTLPHRFSLSINSEVLQALWDGMFAELARAEYRVIVVLSGHYEHGHELVLLDAAEHAINSYGILILAVPPLALVDEQMLDHGGHWETSLMMALKPRLTALEALDGAPLKPAMGVIGEDPHLATPGQGESALALATERIAQSVRALLAHGTPDLLRELYARRRATYRSYVEHYFRGSWEDAIMAWWRDKTREE